MTSFSLLSAFSSSCGAFETCQRVCVWGLWNIHNVCCSIFILTMRNNVCTTNEASKRGRKEREREKSNDVWYMTFMWARRYQFSFEMWNYPCIIGFFLRLLISLSRILCLPYVEWRHHRLFMSSLDNADDCFVRHPPWNVFASSSFWYSISFPSIKNHNVVKNLSETKDSWSDMENSWEFLMRKLIRDY